LSDPLLAVPAVRILSTYIPLIHPFQESPVPFIRSLDHKIADVLNRLSSEEGTWWKTLIQAPKVFIAVRKNELNAYCGGASLGRISWRKGALSFRVHVEYLVFADHGRKDMYFDFLQESQSPRSVTVTSADGYVRHFSAVKALARELASKERAGVNDIAARHKCVLDIEAAFNTLREPKDSGLAPEPVGGRVDLVAADQEGQLVFTEAKLFANDELRLDPIPPVCTQLISYHRWLKDCGQDIQEAYTHMIDTCCLEGKFFQRWNGLRGKKLTVDPIPRLLIFDYDEARDAAELEQIKKRIVEQVCRLIPEFGLGHIRCQKQASRVTPQDIL